MPEFVVVLRGNARYFCDFGAILALFALGVWKGNTFLMFAMPAGALAMAYFVVRSWRRISAGLTRAERNYLSRWAIGWSLVFVGIGFGLALAIGMLTVPHFVREMTRFELTYSLPSSLGTIVAWAILAALYFGPVWALSWTWARHQAPAVLDQLDSANRR